MPAATDAATEAARAMLARPTGVDPDYRSHWPPGTSLRGPVRRAAGVITVDLSADARDGQFGAELAERTVAQLVYTAQGALRSTDPVQILIEGQREDELWGHVAIREPVRRPDPYQTRSFVQINEPAHGATVGGTFQVKGEAAGYGATVLWDVLRDGVVVKSGFTNAAEGPRFSAFGFTLTLEPGEYTLRVTEDDPSGGIGVPPFEDTKLIRVTG